jgi:hypothetical protein
VALPRRISLERRQTSNNARQLLPERNPLRPRISNSAPPLLQAGMRHPPGQMGNRLSSNARLKLRLPGREPSADKRDRATLAGEHMDNLIRICRTDNEEQPRVNASRKRGTAAAGAPAFVDKRKSSCVPGNAEAHVDIGPRSNIGILTRALVYLLWSKLDRVFPEAQRKQQAVAVL